MNRRNLLAVVLVLVVVSAAAAGGKKDPDELQGTWYGGSSNPDNAGYKYQYSFIPTGTGRWFVMADGVYNPDSLGAAVTTLWTGEVLRENPSVRVASWNHRSQGRNGKVCRRSFGAE